MDFITLSGLGGTGEPTVTGVLGSVIECHMGPPVQVSALNGSVCGASEQLTTGMRTLDG